MVNDTERYAILKADFGNQPTKYFRQGQKDLLEDVREKACKKA